MKNKKVILFSVIWSLVVGFGLELSVFSTPCLAAESQIISVIPKPEKIEPAEGSFTLTPDTVVFIKSSALKGVGHYLSDLLAPATGMKLAVRSSVLSKLQTIVLQLDGSRKNLGEEGYTLQTTPKGVTITGATPAGVFYGVQTLRQLLPIEIESTEKVDPIAWTIPCGSIEDQPRFKWRGYLLDPARHFRTKADIKRYIDLLAFHKLNMFQLHLTDDEGWRLEIKKYPKLTETGSRIPDYSGNKGEGWYYSQADINEILAYAASRYVTVVPEIEMPGHSGAAVTAYPELGCSSQPSSEICISLPSAFEFERNVLNEVIALFPSPFIHIGGDEVKPESWRACLPCQEQLEKLSKTPLPADVVPVHIHVTTDAGRPFFEDTARLQGEFIRRIDQYLKSNGRRMIGWDEILEGGLKATSPARIMIWRSAEAIAGATGQKREVIVSTYPDYYLDNNISLQRTYAYEPVPIDLPAEQEKYVVGVQGNMWGEVSTAMDLVDRYSFPRLSAIAEIGWTSRAARNFDDFSNRLTPLLRRLDLMDVKYGMPVSQKTAAN